MITVVAALKTDLVYDNEDGEECNKQIYVTIEIAALPARPITYVELPTPKNIFDVPIQARVHFTFFVGKIVVLHLCADNVSMDQECVESLLRIGYTEDEPEILANQRTGLMIDT